MSKSPAIDQPYTDGFTCRTHGYRANRSEPWRFLTAEEVACDRVRIVEHAVFEDRATGKITATAKTDDKLYDTNPNGYSFWFERMYSFEKDEGAKLNGSIFTGDQVQRPGTAYFMNVTPRRTDYVTGGYRPPHANTALTRRDVSALRAKEFIPA